MTRLEAFKQLWGRMPKTLKVFIYIATSIILSESLIELAHMDQGFVVRVLAQIINLAIVFLQETVPAVKAKFTK